MTAQGEFTNLRREGEHVLKLLDVQHPAAMPLVTAAMATGKAGAEAYIGTLRAHGVRLPAELEVVSERPLAVRHRWVHGPCLPEVAGPAPATFVAAVAEIGQWVRALAATDARVDTNLSNFLLVDDKPVLVDVLPPLVPSRRPEPATLFEVHFDGLCFQTPVILYALVGYAARALIGSGARLDSSAASELVDVGHGLCPLVDDSEEGPLPDLWFRARAAIGLRALRGEVSAQDALAFFALTSVRVFRDLDEPRRRHRIDRVRAAIRAWERR